MKFIKKIMTLTLGTGLALGLGLGTSYATSTTTDPQESASSVTIDQKFVDQRNQLQKAVDDMVNVVNTNSYFNYASQESKDMYEKAIGNATTVLARKDAASFEEVKDATIRINTAKQQINAEVNKAVQKKKLEKAISENKTKVTAAKMLINDYPKTVAKVRPQLEQLLTKSEQLVARAEAVLASL